MSSGVDTGAVCVVLPTYNEAANLEAIAAAILNAVPAGRLLVVDDNSPDGTGDIADRIALLDARVSVLHRRGKEGLGRAYLDGFRAALHDKADVVVQMDADFSHDPAALPELIAPILGGEADLVIGSRYVAGGRVLDWGYGRKLISRGGSLFARVVLGLDAHDLTGGFKAWAAGLLASMPLEGVRAGGYVFQIEMTYRADRAGARITEVPITFRDRLAGVSKMSKRIVLEALWIVLRLRAEEIACVLRRRATPETPSA